MPFLKKSDFNQKKQTSRKEGIKMSKKAKIWLIISILFIIGGIIVLGVMSMFNWDFSKNSSKDFITSEYTLDNFENLSINTKISHIKILPSEDSKASVVCYELKNAKHSVFVKENTLNIKFKDERKWYEHIKVSFACPKISIYLPEEVYKTLNINSSTGDIEIAKDFTFQNIKIQESTGNVKNFASATNEIEINATTGDVLIENISAKSLKIALSTGKISVLKADLKDDIKLKVSTGKTEISNTTCQNLVSSGSTGDMQMEKVIANGTFSIDRTTGNINLKKCDASGLFIKTSTGDVEGSLMSEKVFIAKTDTGDIDLPKTTGGGKCEIISDTGDIKIDIK